MRYSDHVPADSLLGQVTLPSAIQWIKDKLQAFYALPMRIGNLQRRAQQVEAIATQKGAAQAVEQLRSARAELNILATRHYGVADKVKWLLQQLGAAGVQLGNPVVIPLAIIAAAALTATAIAALFAGVSKQEGLIAAVEKGVLSPEEAQKIGRAPLIGLNLGPIVPYVALGAAAYFLLPRLLARAGRRRGQR